MTEAEKSPKNPCRWWLWSDDSNTWATDCGNDFQLTEGTPSQHGLTHCGYCGGQLVAYAPKE